MNTDECLKIVQGFKVGRLIGASEFAAIKALLESIEHYRDVIAAMACQPESIEPAPYALSYKGELIPNQPPYNLVEVRLGPLIQGLQTSVGEDSQMTYTESSPPKA